MDALTAAILSHHCYSPSLNTCRLRPHLRLPCVCSLHTIATSWWRATTRVWVPHCIGWTTLPLCTRSTRAAPAMVRGGLPRENLGLPGHPGGQSGVLRVAGVARRAAAAASHCQLGQAARFCAFGSCASVSLACPCSRLIPCSGVLPFSGLMFSTHIVPSPMRRDPAPLFTVFADLP